MIENQTVPDPLSQDTQTPITTGGTIPEDPWLADDQTAPVEATARQRTLVLTDAEPRRSLHDRVRQLGHKHADPLSQTQPQDPPRAARITALAITTVSLCLTTALITSVITSRSQHAASTGQPRQPANHRCISTRQGKPRPEHPQHSQAALETVRAQPQDNQRPSAESQPQPTPPITSERQPEVAVPPPSNASETTSTPAASPSEPEVPNHEETHTQTAAGDDDGGPFSP